jgi:hypothetical protein
MVLCSFIFTESSSGVRNYSSGLGSSATFWDSTRWSAYKELTHYERILALLKAGLELKGVDTSKGHIESLWKKAHPLLPAYNRQDPKESLIRLARSIKSISFNESSEREVHTCSEAVQFLQPMDATPLEKERPQTSDAKKALGLVDALAKPGVFLFEDGTRLGDFLFTAIPALLQRGFYVERALGVDINEDALGIANLCSRVVKLDSYCYFASANVLKRRSPRVLMEDKTQLISIGLRMIPVLDGQEALSYLNKLSRDLKRGDYWIGSIACRGSLMHSVNCEKVAIKESSMRVERSTPVGGETFRYRIMEEYPDEVLINHFRKTVGLKVSPTDLCTIVTNTYYSRKEFESLVRLAGLKIKEIREVEGTETYNLRDKIHVGSEKKLVVVLEKE